MWFYENPDKYVCEFLICDYKYLMAKICANHDKTIHAREVKIYLQLNRPLSLRNFSKSVH